MDIVKIMSAVEEIAKKAWRIALEYRDKWFFIEEKTSSIDLVTEVDHIVDSFITKALTSLTPSWTVRTEESSIQPHSFDWFTWIVDPIDGTYDFVHGWSWWSILIWLAKNWIPYAWVVMIPESWRIYSAVKWYWFLSNTLPYTLSACTVLSEACIHYSTQLDISFSQTQKKLLNDSPWRYQKTKENYFEELISWKIEWIFCSEKVCGPRDVCAPVVLIEEAWWKMTTLEWDPFNFAVHHQIWYIGSNWNVHNDLLNIVKHLNTD